MPQAQESSSTIPVGDPKALRCAGVLCLLNGHATSKSRLGNVLSTMKQKEHQASLPFLLLHQARHLVSKPRSLAKAIYRRTKQKLPSVSGSSLFHFLVPLSIVSDPFLVHVLPPASVAISAYVVMRGRRQRIQISKPESTLCFSGSVKLPWDSSKASRKGKMMRKSMLANAAWKRKDQQNQ